MAVPINAPEFDSNLHLCYEIHGAVDQYFNFVSDECISINAHYVQAPRTDLINIIDSMSFVAVDDQGICHHISVDVVNCSATVDGNTLQPMSRKQSTVNSPYEEKGIFVHSYTFRVRISVPDCADNTLVMWVICQHQSLYNPFTKSFMEPIDNDQV